MNKLFFVTEPEALPENVQSQLAAYGFTGAAGQVQRLVKESGETQIYVGIDHDNPFGFWTGAQACQGAKGLKDIHVQNPQVLSDQDRQDFALSWLLESYRYGVFKAPEPVTVLDGVDISARTHALAGGLGLVRDLINTPANHMRPGDLENEVRDLAEPYGGTVNLIAGEALATGFPLIHAVGAAAGQGVMAPRLIDLNWGHGGRCLTLIGKGVTFDSGGLNLKPGQGMRLMKKDMGGAAHVLGLAHMIMALDLPLRLRVLIPAVENSLGPDAFRPGDVLVSRAGISVEIDNTDAEGRLVLADALTLACESSQASDLTLSMATLTGAARVAVGPAIAPFFCTDQNLQDALMAHAGDADPIWPLPLYQPYGEYLNSDIADLANAGGGGFAGAITAALFLQQFVDPRTPWAHFDVYGWNGVAKPGRPKGGAAQGLISLLTYLETWVNPDRP